MNERLSVATTMILMELNWCRSPAVANGSHQKEDFWPANAKPLGVRQLIFHGQCIVTLSTRNFRESSHGLSHWISHRCQRLFVRWID